MRSGVAVAVMVAVASLPSSAASVVATPVPASLAVPAAAPMAPIVAANVGYVYSVPEIGVTIPQPPPRAVAVHHVRVHGSAPAPRADLGTVYAAGASAVGVPYVAGGKSPDGFDCSGFVSWAYAQAGVSLPATTGGIKRRATVISAADARPGDILYWPGHVALYAGPGLRLDANRSGSTVQVRAIYGKPTYLRIG